MRLFVCEIRAKKARNSDQNEMMKTLCCVIPCGQTDTGSLQHHFLPFRVLLNVGIDPNFPQKGFFWLYSGEILA